MSFAATTVRLSLVEAIREHAYTMHGELFISAVDHKDAHRRSDEAILMLKGKPTIAFREIGDITLVKHDHLDGNWACTMD